jgi:hypothetical protein
MTFWEHWSDPCRIAGHDEDADIKWLPPVLPIMEIPRDRCINAEVDYFKGGGGE